MSLYNIVNGFNPACVWIMPMLGRKQDEWPRFRNCFVSDNNTTIEIYTRVGGGNRGQGFGEEELYKDPNFIKTWDDEYDNTYATYEFKVPDKWVQDFNHIITGEFSKVSKEYQDYLRAFWPALNERGVFDGVFKNIYKE